MNRYQSDNVRGSHREPLSDDLQTKINNSLVKMTYMNENHNVQFFLMQNKGINILKIKDKRQYNIAHICAVNNNIRLFKIFVKQISKDHCEKSIEQIKIWINSQNDEGFTPLHFAAFKGNLDFIEILEELGADIHAVTNHGLNLLHVAAQGDQPNSLYYFRMKGLNINQPDAKGSTPLHWAAYLGSENAINYMCCWEVNINQADYEGQYTPLHLAVIAGNSRIVRKLVIKGANKDIQDKLGKTPLQIAKQHQFFNIIDLLEPKNSIWDICDIKPKLGPAVKNRNQLYFFLFYLIFSNFTLVFCLFPYIKEKHQKILYISIYSCTFLSFLIVWLRNPGYLKKTIPSSERKSKDFLQLLQTYESYCLCPYCEIMKPQRSRHCELCQSCVSVFDHHCPWINNCIGSKNHNIFLIYIISLWINMLYNFLIIALYYLEKDQAGDPLVLKSFGILPEFLTQNLFIIKLLLVGIQLVIQVLFFVPLSMLVWLHINNFLMNRTTSERHGYNKKGNSSDLNQQKRTSELSEEPVMKNFDSKRSRDMLQDVDIQQKSFEINDPLLKRDLQEEEMSLGFFDYCKNCYRMCYSNAKDTNYSENSSDSIRKKRETC